MRDLIIIAFILILVFGGGYWIDNYLQKTEDDLISRIDDLHTQIEYEDFDHIDKVYEFDKLWNTSKTKWHILGNHHDIDEIEAQIKRFIQAYEYRDSLESLLSAVEIRFRISDMHKGDKLEISNIL